LTPENLKFLIILKKHKKYENLDICKKYPKFDPPKPPILGVRKVAGKKPLGTGNFGRFGGVLRDPSGGVFF
jgi:hypothetical protein